MYYKKINVKGVILLSKNNNDELCLSKFDELILLAYFIDALNKLNKSIRETSLKVFKDRNCRNN